MYHALEFEDGIHAEEGREFLVVEISEDLGDKIRALSPDDCHRLQNRLLNELEK